MCKKLLVEIKVVLSRIGQILDLNGDQNPIINITQYWTQWASRFLSREILPSSVQLYNIVFIRWAIIEIDFEVGKFKTQLLFTFPLLLNKFGVNEKFDLHLG